MDNKLPLKSEIMTYAKDLIEKGWCKRHSATDKFGNITGTTSECAENFCTAGAIWRAAHDVLPFSTYNTLVINELIIDFLSANKIKSIPDWNDRWYRTKKSVLKAFDNAINYVKENEDEIGVFPESKNETVGGIMLHTMSNVKYECNKPR